MGIRLSLIVVPALLLVGFLAFVTVAVALVLARPLSPAPAEPLVFDHSVHVQVAGLDCAFCHRTADQTYTPGLPDVQQCMFCHSVVSQVQAAPAQYGDDLNKLRAAWQSQQPIDWVKNHRLPDHVHFVHEAHLRSLDSNGNAITCATCHGDVQNMGLAKQVRPLNMGDCVNCHRDNGAPTECATCHY